MRNFFIEFKYYFRYFKYVLKHKWYVMLECWKMGLIWQGIIHDISKFHPKEFFPYAHKFQGGDYAFKYFEVENDFQYAWLRHQHKNKHHWNYWIVNQIKKDALPMPEKYVKEMVSDWKAMGKMFGDTAEDFYWKNKEKMILHYITIGMVLKILYGK